MNLLNILYQEGPIILPLHTIKFPQINTKNKPKMNMVATTNIQQIDKKISM